MKPPVGKGGETTPGHQFGQDIVENLDLQLLWKRRPRQITSVKAPVPGPSSNTRRALGTFADSMIRWASATDEGRMAPVVFQLLKNSRTKVEADMRRFLNIEGS